MNSRKVMFGDVEVVVVDLPHLAMETRGQGKSYRVTPRRGPTEAEAHRTVKAAEERAHDMVAVLCAAHHDEVSPLALSSLFWQNMSSLHRGWQVEDAYGGVATRDNGLSYYVMHECLLCRPAEAEVQRTVKAAVGRTYDMIANLYGNRLGQLTASRSPLFGSHVGSLHRGWQVKGASDRPSWTSTSNRLRAVAARRLLLQLEEKRAVAAANEAGRPQTEIARALGVSQPTVHRILRQVAVDPAVLERGPLEIVATAVVGLIDRETMLLELAVLDPKPGEPKPDADGYVLGAWDEVVDAWERGWLTDEEYEQLARL